MAIELVTGHAGAAHVSSADAGALNAGVFGKGAYWLGGKDAKPKVVMSDANHVSIGPCELLIHGRHIRITSAETVAIASGAQTGNRNDLVYLEYTFDSSTATENIALKVAKGSTVSGTAKDPNLPYPTSILDGATTADIALVRVTISELTPTPELLLESFNQLDVLSKATDTGEKTLGELLDFKNEANRGLSNLGESVESIKRLGAGIIQNLTDLMCKGYIGGGESLNSLTNTTSACYTQNNTDVPVKSWGNVLSLGNGIENGSGQQNIRPYSAQLAINNLAQDGHRVWVRSKVNGESWTDWEAVGFSNIKNMWAGSIVKDVEGADFHLFSEAEFKNITGGLSPKRDHFAVFIMSGDDGAMRANLNASIQDDKNIVCFSSKALSGKKRFNYFIIQF